MTLTLGRLTGLSDPSSVQWSNGVLSMSGYQTCSSLAQYQAYRAGLDSLGQMGNPEPIVCSTDTSLTGMYVVERVSVDSDPALFNQRCLRFSLTARQLAPYQATVAALRSNGRERTGAGGVSEDYWVAVPSDVYGFDLSGDTAVFYTRTGPGGSARMYVDASLENNVATYEVDPGDWYDMSPALTVDGYTVTGRQVLSIGNATDWTLANGYLRIRNGATAADTFRMAGPDPANTAVYQPDAEHAFRYGLYLSGAMRTFSPTSLQCRRLTCEVCQIRLRGYVNTAATDDDYAVVLDITMRRGGSYIECVGSSIASAIHRCDEAAGDALTVVTASKTLHSSANDADGNRWWIASGTTLNTGLAASGSTRTNASVTQWPFGLGIELNGSSSVSPNLVSHGTPEQFDHYWADQTILVEVGA